MTSGPCHFPSLHSHFADCLVPELPLAINLHHSPSLTSASWHLSQSLTVTFSLSLSLLLSFLFSLFPSPPPFSVSPSPILSYPVIFSYPAPLVNRCEPKSHCMSAVAEHIFQSACLLTAHILMLRVISEAADGAKATNLDTEMWLVILRGG